MTQDGQVRGPHPPRFDPRRSSRGHRTRRDLCAAVHVPGCVMPRRFMQAEIVCLR